MTLELSDGDRVFGDFLVERGVCTPAEMAGHLEAARGSEASSLADHLVEEGVLAPGTRRSLQREVREGTRPCSDCGRPTYVRPEDRGSRPLCSDCADGSDTSSAREPASPLPVELQDEESPRRYGKYEIVERIAAGGMGVVLRARDPDLDRDVALKILRTRRRASDEHVERFRREARSVARLAHPHVVRVHAFGREGATIYFTMELLEGESFEQLLERRGEVSDPGDLEDLLRRGAAVLRDVARAVGYAHGEGVVHRDLKPANVLLGADGRARVTDFGLARDSAFQTLTREGDLLGTPLYMSPEQIGSRKTKAGPPTDIFAIGVMLYELLADVHPFRATSLVELQRRIVRDDPTPPRQLEEAVPRDLQTITLKALRKAPRDRYPTADDLADDLERFLEGRPIRARPRSTVSRLGSVIRRRPARTALAAAILALLGTLGIVAVARSGPGAGDRVRAEATQLAEAGRADLRRARVLLDRGEVGEAIGLLEGVRERLPGLRSLVGRLEELEVSDGPPPVDDLAASTSRTLADALLRRGDPADATRATSLLEGLGDPTVRDLVLLARARHRDGLREAAGAALERALARDTDRRDARRLRARLRHEAGRFAEAIADWESVLARDPDHVGAHVGRGRSLLAAGRAGEALDDARAVLAGDDAHAGALALLGEALAAVDRRIEGRRALDRALDAAPGSPVVRHARARFWLAEEHPDRAREELAALDGELSPRGHLLRGRVRLLDLELEEARADLDAAAAGAPAVAREALVSLARVHRLAGHAGAAVRALDRALAFSPDDVELRLARGRARLDAGDLDGATRDGRSVVGEHPDRVEGLLLLAACRRRTGRPGEAYRLADRAVLVQPGPAARAERGAARLAQGDAPGAREDLLRSLRLPSDPDPAAAAFHRSALRLRGRAVSASGPSRDDATLLEDAAARFRAAAVLEPHRALARLDHARCLVDLGRTGEARSVLDGVLEDVPPFPAARRLRAELSAEAGDLDAAIADLSAAIEVRGPVPDLLLARGDLHRRAGSSEAALADLERVVEEEPGYGPGHAALADLREAIGDEEAAERLRERDRARRDEAGRQVLVAYEDASSLMQAERWTRVPDLLDRVLERDPPGELRATAIFYRGVAHAQLGRPLASLRDHLRAMRLHPLHTLFLFEYVHSIARMGLSFEEVLAEVRTEVEEAPSSPDRLLLEGAIWTLRHSVAGEEGASEESPDPATRRAWRARARVRLDEALVRDPDAAVVHLVRAVLATDAGELVRARRSAETALAIAPLAEGMARYLLARTLALAGRRTAALEELRRAVGARRGERPIGFHTVEWARRDPAIRPLRDGAAFEELVDRMREIAGSIWR